MDDMKLREEFDTGLLKIRHEIKSRLVHHGLFGSVTNVDIDSTEHATAGAAPAPSGSTVTPVGTTIKIVAKGRTAARSFDRKQIEDCRLRVGGAVLSGIISMVDELAASH